MSKNALIVWGGWDGHQPREVADVFRAALSADGFSVEVSDTLDSFRDESRLLNLDLIVPIWTMGKIDVEPLTAVCNAVSKGVGMAGCHGGMCDAFRDSPEWQFLTGGQWVAHPGNDTAQYAVNVKTNAHPIVEGIGDFNVHSEQYYMHVDPAVKVLATTRFPTADGPHVSNGPVDMPVVWTKLYGAGRVFYSSIGHTPADVKAEPHLTILRRGCAWAAR
ncbi:MAG TPA: ThuA domain-containing protein [Tepidisphaeraceae bacterium]|jgi:hypothetical protein|nr:ThuA domain-containing protein [Tepidisphaeraceae bacterium]